MDGSRSKMPILEGRCDPLSKKKKRKKGRCDHMVAGDMIKKTSYQSITGQVATFPWDCKIMRQESYESAWSQVLTRSSKFVLICDLWPTVYILLTLRVSRNMPLAQGCICNQVFYDNKISFITEDHIICLPHFFFWGLPPNTWGRLKKIKF